MIISADKLKESFGHRSLFEPMDDRAYFLLPEDYFHRFIDDWKAHKQRIGMVYRKERTDCDDFVRIFLGRIAEAALSINADAGPAVGTARVTNHKETLGIPAGEHVLIFIGILRHHSIAWIIYDPITDLYETLYNYTGELRSLAI